MKTLTITITQIIKNETIITAIIIIIVILLIKIDNDNT